MLSDALADILYVYLFLLSFVANICWWSMALVLSGPTLDSFMSCRGGFN